MKTTLRWLAVLPVAILGGILACFPLHFILILVCSNTPESMITNKDGVSILYLHRDDIERFLTPLASSIGFVVSGARISPKKHFETASILLGIYFLSVGFVFYGIANNLFSVAVKPNYWSMSVGVAGGLLALWIVRFKSLEWTTK